MIIISIIIIIRMNVPLMVSARKINATINAAVKLLQPPWHNFVREPKHSRSKVVAAKHGVQPENVISRPTSHSLSPVKWPGSSDRSRGYMRFHRKWKSYES